MTCSKLKTNCTNPSYQVLQFPFMSSRSGFLLELIIIPFYSPFFGWVLFEMPNSLYSSFPPHFIIILLFHFSLWPFHFRLAEKVYVVAFSTLFFLDFLRDIDVLFSTSFSLFSFEWVFKIFFKIANKEKPKRKRRKKLMKKWWEEKLATSH